MMWVTVYVPECQMVYGIHRETLISTVKDHIVGLQRQLLCWRRLDINQVNISLFLN